jgi:hypothetical protein
MGWRRGVLIGVVVLLAAGSLLALVGAEGDGGEDAGAVQATDAGGDEMRAASGTPAAVGSGDMGAAAGSGGAAGGSVGAAPLAQPDAVPPASDRIIRRAELSLEVKRGTFSRAFDEASRVAARHGGFVAGSTSATNEGELASGSLTLRVPAAAFDAARADLGRLGKVERQQLSGEDVGGQLVDLDARLASLRAQEDALRTLMGRATTVGQTLEVQNQLFAVRQQIEVLAGQQAQLRDAVQLSTITVALAEPGVAATRPAEGAEGLARSFERAVDGAEAVVGGTIVAIGYAIPLGLLAALAWLGLRLAARRNRAPAAVSAS